MVHGWSLRGWDALTSRCAVLYVEFAAALLILVAAQLSAAVASATPTTVPIGQSLSSSLGTVSPMQYPSYDCYTWKYSWCYQNYWGNYWWSYPYYGNYYFWNYPYYPYYYTTTVAEKARTFDLNVGTNPAGIAPVNGKGTYNDGTAASFSVTSLIIPSKANQRYVFSYWSGDFSGASPSGTVTMDSAKSVVANYQLQNLLKVSADPLGVTSASGEGWYLPTDSVTVGPLPSSISGGEGARYVFQQWTIDSVPASGTSVQIMMDAPHTLVAHYKTQYLLTVSSDYGIVQGGGWYDAGSSATFSVTTEVDTSYGVKQVFEKWTGDMKSTSASSTITMDSPHTLRAVWRTDSTVLYATIALAICAAFVLGIGLTMLSVARLREPKPAPAPPPKPVAAVEPVSEELKPAPTKKKAKQPPKTNPSEPASKS
jgi:hypothetical protein